MSLKMLLTIVCAYVILCVFAYRHTDAQAKKQKSAEELYQRTWLVGGSAEGSVRVTRMLDETTDNTCYIAQNISGTSVGIYCVH